jgi:DMSO/TMAO reductase YedYZ molybdopterin-dependent catalytic subunit
VSARGTDWSLALLVALLVATGVLTAFAGSSGDAWVFASHGAFGAALAIVLVWKGRRVFGRVVDPTRWDGRTGFGVVAAMIVLLTLGSGFVWSAGGDLHLGGFGLLNWHWALGAVLGALVLVHALLRAKRPRARDLAGRRQLLATAGVAVGAIAFWQLQRPVAALFGLRGAKRRFTGSYEADSFAGNAFPSTSWVSDHPRELPAARHRVSVNGLCDRPLELRTDQLDAGDELVATLDCTGGFYSTQRWRGVRLGRVLAAARPRPDAAHVRVVSHTGYRWSFPLAAARPLLLATHVGDEALSHDHGAPVRLVAPGRRGFQWVKWVDRIELHDGPDPGAPASTVWSSFTPDGTGA